MKSSIGIALSVSYLPVPREPSSSDTRAIVFSSGASITLTKSNSPERRPLRLDGRAELLDLAVDLADPAGVVLDRLHALGGQRRQHDVGRHLTLLTRVWGVALKP